jgi:hypothetical protein
VWFFGHNSAKNSRNLFLKLALCLFYYYSQAVCTPEVNCSAYGLGYDYVTVLSVEVFGFSAITQPKIVVTDFVNLHHACITKTVLRVFGSSWFRNPLEIAGFTDDQWKVG